MGTFMAKAHELQRQWYIIDADGKPLGRVAAQAAAILRGKHKAEFTPHCDCGDHVIIINAAKAVLTGKKLLQKHYYRHTGYVGGIKAVRYDKLMSERPEFAMTKAIKGMLPHNTVGDLAAKRLRVYAGDTHEHAAQKPEAWTQEIK
ncbi:MAG: 50S ribosomal protein L13 [Ruminococcaceae bacterium]|nr:50S ribosomal protein L13 [Oscillospiraceae bacterium]